tara:strand:+ start:54 stop:182 length:129 start_codon:yes stop_codon:yes gene_type:complete
MSVIEKMAKMINGGNKEAVMTYYKFKDAKVVHQEIGATKLAI